MIQIQLTDVQHKNLLAFLDRVQIKGFTEVQAFNEIINVLNSPVVEPQNDATMQENK